MTGKPVFSRPLVFGFAALALTTFAVSLYFMTRQRDAIDALGPGAHSRSAIGYEGLAETLERLDIPVIRSKHNAARKARGGVLVLAEPRQDRLAEAEAELGRAEQVLLVLPKWAWERSRRRSAWVGHVRPRNPWDARRVLRLALDDGDIARVPEVKAWPTNAFTRAPAVAGPVQLVTSERLRPLVAGDQGILLGEIVEDGRRIWVLSDPDVLANHGLGADGRGAVFAVELIAALRRGTGPVVFDETIHGFIARPAAPALMMFQFPFVIVTLQGVLAAALLLWATMGRFGAPEPPPAPLKAGRQGLVDNVAALMEFAGHHRLMARRYVAAMLRDAARQLHAPKGLSEAEMMAWLQRAGTARGVSLDGAAIHRRAEALVADRRADPAALVALTRDIYHWKQEIIDGPSGHKRHHRGGAR